MTAYPVADTVSISGVVAVTGSVISDRPLVATMTRVTASSSSEVLVFGKVRRATLTMFNDSPSDLLIAYGLTSSYATGFTYYVSPYATLELPQPIYTGDLAGVWEQATGSVRITETLF